MAEFVTVDKNKYKIVGTLTDVDIDKINLFKNRTTLILDNTVNLSSDFVSKIVSDRVVFSIKGGLDYDIKEKYKDKKYVDRTFVSPCGLKNIIKYFEYNENLIDKNWNELEKAMFLYNALVVDMEYGKDYENMQSPGTTERSLNGILYGKLVCAGFAQVYKEMLDRVGIKNYYQNQKDVHAFNIIEVDDKKYGVDVTWDNNDKKNNYGRCGFGRFGHDPEFYTRHGHQLYKEIDVSDDFEITDLLRFYDTDEEVYDLSLLTMDQLNEYYSHIVSRINSRKPFRYNLQDQPLVIRNKYLPVDIVDFELKQEASQEYPVVVIIDFLKKRNALQINSGLLEAFSRRKGYLLDIGDCDGRYRYDVDLSLIGINNYVIDRSGNIAFNNGDERRHSAVWGVDVGYSNIPQEQLNTLYSNLNQYLNQFFNKCILDIISNLDVLLENYEYKPDEWDTNRAIEYHNIYSKLSLIVNSHDYLKKLGKSEQEIEGVIGKIMQRHDEIHMSYEKNVNQRDYDLDFLSVVFSDFNMVWQTIEYDLQKKIVEEEFVSLYCNVDYMIKLFEKYIIISEDGKFRFDEYNILKEDLQQLLNKIILGYFKKNLSELTELDINQSYVKER